MAKRMFWVSLLLLLGLSIPAAASPCTDQCWADYDACVGPGCSSYWHCAACDEARDNCLNACPSSAFTSVPEFAISPVGAPATSANGCFLSSPPQAAPPAK